MVFYIVILQKFWQEYSFNRIPLKCNSGTVAWSPLMENFWLRSGCPVSIFFLNINSGHLFQTFHSTTMNVFIFSLSNIRIFFTFIYNKILFYNNSFNLIEFKNILFKFLESKLKQTILTFDFPEKIQTIYPE